MFAEDKNWIDLSWEQELLLDKDDVIYVIDVSLTGHKNFKKVQQYLSSNSLGLSMDFSIDDG